jgi:hypothetical protein
MATLGRFLKQKQQQQVEEPAPSPAPLKKPKAIGRNLMIGGGLTTAAALPIAAYGMVKHRPLPFIGGVGAIPLGAATLALGTGYALANRAARKRKQQGGYKY